MPRRSTRSRSRGRTDLFQAGAAPISPSRRGAKKEVKKVEPPSPKKMAFDEGDEVMARWPGSSLFFKAKVTLLRPEDNEYDVQYENGVVYTTKAKDVYRASSKVIKTSRRGRSRTPSRKKKVVEEAPAKEEEAAPAAAEEAAAPADAAPAEEAAAPEAAAAAPDAADAVAAPPPAEPETPKKEPEKPKKPAKVLKAETPTRTSRRIAEKLAADQFSDDEGVSVKLAPNPELPDARGKKKGWSFEWLWAIVFMLLGPAILVSLHNLCTKDGCKLAVPTISTDLKSYIDKEAVLLVIGYGAVVKLLPLLLPIGKTVKALNGGEVRMNGFLTLLTLLSVVPALVYHKVPLNIVYDKYNFIMATCIIFPFIGALQALIYARWAKKSNTNSKGNTGNIIVDYFNGRELNPKLWKFDFKLIMFRFSMIALALLNVVMVADNIVKNNGNANPAVVLASAFQVLYALDAMFFEEYYFNSHDAMNSGYGWSLISSYTTFPFLPTLITKYLIDRSPVVPWYYLALIGLMNAVGYVIFRSSETQRCEFAKDPASPSLAHLETVVTAGGRKLIVSGWWGLVRHPNYLGEVLIQWSWVLPTVGTAGLTDLLPYYLPFVTTLMIVIRCHQINQRNKRKYGTAWDGYCEKVRSNIIPKVY